MSIRYKFPCQEKGCDAKFHTKSSLNMHFLRKHRGMGPQTGVPAPWLSKAIRARKAEKAARLAAAKLAAAAKTTVRTVQDVQRPVMKLQVVEERPFNSLANGHIACIDCGGEFVGLNGLRNHERIVHGITVQPRANHVDGRKIVQTEYFTPEVRNGRIVCDQCNLTYKSVTGFRAHRRYVHNIIGGIIDPLGYDIEKNRLRRERDQQIRLAQADTNGDADIFDAIQPETKLSLPDVITTTKTKRDSVRADIKSLKDRLETLMESERQLAQTVAMLERIE